MKNYIKHAIAVFMVLMTGSSLASSGVQLDRTRVLMTDGKTRTNYALSNHTETPILASATITNVDGTPTSKLTVNPALYQVRSKSTHQGSIMLLEPLPQDKESVFWLNVKTVAPESGSKESSSSLQFAIGQRIKVFYRPKGIKDDCKIAADNLKWTKTTKGLKVKNDSAVSVSIVEVTVGNKKHRIEDILLAKSSQNWNLPTEATSPMSFTYVDEYGNYVEHPLELN